MTVLQLSQIHHLDVWKKEVENVCTDFARPSREWKSSLRRMDCDNGIAFTAIDIDGREP